ncbi:MAG: hypothetical protein ACWGMZ_02020 [Thermoguttaceae bacterium]
MNQDDQIHLKKMMICEQNVLAPNEAIDNAGEQTVGEAFSPFFSPSTNSVQALPEEDKEDKAVLAAAEIAPSCDTESDLQISYNIHLPVLARIPNLDGLARAPGKKESTSSARPSVSSKTSVAYSRLINSNLSVKLLMALGVLLLLAAIVPFIPESFTENNLAKSDQHSDLPLQSPSAEAELAPAWKAPAESDQTPMCAKSELSTSATGSKNLSTPESVVTNKDLGKQGSALTPETNPTVAGLSSPWPSDNYGVNSAPMFSPWPNPAHPIVVRSEPQNGKKLAIGEASKQNEKNRVRAVGVNHRPYTADRRNMPLNKNYSRLPTDRAPIAAGTGSDLSNQTNPARFEGVIKETPSDRNNYDRFRSGVH